MTVFQEMNSIQETPSNAMYWRGRPFLHHRNQWELGLKLKQEGEAMKMNIHLIEIQGDMIIIHTLKSTLSNIVMLIHITMMIMDTRGLQDIVDVNVNVNVNVMIMDMMIMIIIEVGFHKAERIAVREIMNMEVEGIAMILIMKEVVGERAVGESVGPVIEKV